MFLLTIWGYFFFLPRPTFLVIPNRVSDFHTQPITWNAHELQNTQDIQRNHSKIPYFHTSHTHNHFFLHAPHTTHQMHHIITHLTTSDKTHFSLIFRFHFLYHTFYAHIPPTPFRCIKYSQFYLIRPLFTHATINPSTMLEILLACDMATRSIL